MHLPPRLTLALLLNRNREVNLITCALLVYYIRQASITGLAVLRDGHRANSCPSGSITANHPIYRGHIAKMAFPCQPSLLKWTTADRYMFNHRNRNFAECPPPRTLSRRRKVILLIPACCTRTKGDVEDCEEDDNDIEIKRKILCCS